MDKRLVKIDEAARLLGTDPVTLRKWGSTGELLPARKTKGGTRYYDVSELMGFRALRRFIWISGCLPRGWRSGKS